MEFQPCTQIQPNDGFGSEPALGDTIGERPLSDPQADLLYHRVERWHLAGNGQVLTSGGLVSVVV